MREKKKKNLKNKKNNLLENPDLMKKQIDHISSFIEKYKSKIIGIVTTVIIVLIGLISYRYYINRQDIIAQEQLFPTIFFFEKDSLEQALLGDGGNFTDGLLTISQEYAMTNAANLANFYIGAIYLKQADYANAITFLKKFSADDDLLQARVYSLIADAYIEQGEIKQAINYYKKAANYKPNEGFTPDYLMKLAFAYELEGNNKEAAKIYRDIIQKYNSSLQLNNAKKFLARIESFIKSE